MIENEVLSDFVKMSKMLEEKSQCIKKLEEQIQGMVQDQIDLLAQRTKELALYKKALELACIKITKEELRENKEIIETIIADYLKEAKEKIDEQK